MHYTYYGAESLIPNNKQPSHPILQAPAVSSEMQQQKEKNSWQPDKIQMSRKATHPARAARAPWRIAPRITGTFLPPAICLLSSMPSHWAPGGCREERKGVSNAWMGAAGGNSQCGREIHKRC